MIVPRFIRFRDAPTYLGMDKDRFNAEVRPYLIEIPIGKQGIAFDRLTLTPGLTNIGSARAAPARR